MGLLFQGKVLLVAMAFSLVAAGAASAAAWQQSDRPDLGYLVEFPGKPVEATGVFKAISVTGAPTHISSVRTEDGVFAVTVVDFPNREKDGATLMGETEFLLSLLGDVTGISTSRIPPGVNAVFGRFITIKIRRGRIPEQPGQTDAAWKWFTDATGLEVPDGSRMTTNMFFRAGRLYLFQGVNLPDDEDGPQAVRFVQSMRWSPELTTTGDNLTRAPAER